MQARLDDVLRQIENVGGFQRGQVLDISQQDYGPVVFRQRADCLIERSLHFRLQELIVRQSGPIGDLKLDMAPVVIHPREEVIERELARGSKNTLPPLHQAGVLGNTKDPGTNPFGFSKLIEALENLYQRVLRHVFRIVALAAHQPTVMEDLGSEVLDEAIERFCIARYQSPRELNFDFPFQGSPLLIVSGFAM